MYSATANDRSIPRMIDVQEVAAILHISARSVWRLVSLGDLPRPMHFGRSARWRLTDVEAWIESCASNQQTNSQVEHRRRRQQKRQAILNGQATNGLR